MHEDNKGVRLMVNPIPTNIPQTNVSHLPAQVDNAPETPGTANSVTEPPRTADKEKTSLLGRLKLIVNRNKQNVICKMVSAEIKRALGDPNQKFPEVTVKIPDKEPVYDGL